MLQRWRSPFSVQRRMFAMRHFGANQRGERHCCTTQLCSACAGHTLCLEAPLPGPVMQHLSNDVRRRDEAAEQSGRSDPHVSTTPDHMNDTLTHLRWVGARSPIAAYPGTAEAIESEAHVLFIGESGVGKTLLGRIVHAQSKRRQRALVSLNCSGLDGLAAVELFGHDLSAGSGALGPSVGVLERSSGSTVYLDDVSRLPVAVQDRLAEVLESSTIGPVGTMSRRACDARIIASSTIDPLSGDERLSGRLAHGFGAVVRIPALREREDDVVLLARHFAGEHAARHGVVFGGLTHSAIQVLREYDWPGNVRQLRNAVERAVLSARGAAIDAEHLPPEIAGKDATLETRMEDYSLEGVERRHIRRVLTMTNGRLSEAADLLRIHRNTLRRKLEEFGITVERT